MSLRISFDVRAKGSERWGDGGGVEKERVLGTVGEAGMVGAGVIEALPIEHCLPHFCSTGAPEIFVALLFAMSLPYITLPIICWV